ncbi:MAG: hypothetical protein QXS54_03280 [Candidatus Methanomethylicaceae archaeon]
MLSQEHALLLVGVQLKAEGLVRPHSMVLQGLPGSVVGRTVSVQAAVGGGEDIQEIALLHRGHALACLGQGSSPLQRRRFSAQFMWLVVPSLICFSFKTD